ncbi:MAG: hypothetical protein AVDCRST_MAG40-3332, partial [uncultured Gemmatimonadaceae bacterium]
GPCRSPGGGRAAHRRERAVRAAPPLAGGARRAGRARRACHRHRTGRQDGVLCGGRQRVLHHPGRLFHRAAGLRGGHLLPLRAGRGDVGAPRRRVPAAGGDAGRPRDPGPHPRPGRVLARVPALRRARGGAGGPAVRHHARPHPPRVVDALGQRVELHRAHPHLRPARGVPAHRAGGQHPRPAGADRPGDLGGGHHHHASHRVRHLRPLPVRQHGAHRAAGRLPRGRLGAPGGGRGGPQLRQRRARRQLQPLRPRARLQRHWRRGGRVRLAGPAVRPHPRAQRGERARARPGVLPAVL